MHTPSLPGSLLAALVRTRCECVCNAVGDAVLMHLMCPEMSQMILHSRKLMKWCANNITTWSIWIEVEASNVLSAWSQPGHILVSTWSQHFFLSKKIWTTCVLFLFSHQVLTTSALIVVVCSHRKLWRLCVHLKFFVTLVYILRHHGLAPSEIVYMLQLCCCCCIKPLKSLPSRVIW